MKLSVIIVSYNVKYYLDQCIRSVLRAFEVMQGDDASSSSSSSGEKDVAEIIVVDNHSSDGSLEYLQRRYPREAYPMVRFVGSNHNLGFARANNIAIRQSEAEYVLLLNPDTIVGEQVLSECIRFMDAHPDAGAAGVRMLNADGRWARRVGEDCLHRWFPSSRCWGSATDGPSIHCSDAIIWDSCRGISRTG